MPAATGKLTRLLLQNLPRGRVVGLDLSRNMVRLAHDNLEPELPGRCTSLPPISWLFHSVNQEAQIDVPACFDGIFSTASFHWVLDHDALFRSLYASLKGGGWLHAQCGGGPNLKRLRERVGSLSRTSEFAHWLGDFREPWFFSHADGAATRLRAAGLSEVETGLEAAAFAVPSSDEFQSYLRTFVRDGFVRQLADACAHDNPPWTLDYWRLNLRGRKSV